MSKGIITLFQMEDCPYCGLVRRKLQALGLDYQVKVQHSNSDLRTDVIELSGQKSVPLLQDGDTVMDDSAKIMAYLDETYGKGAEALEAKHYDITTQVKGTYEAVREKCIEVFKEQGFGLITEIDVKKTMKAKLDLDVEPNGILGFCNPKIAHAAMEQEPDVGLLLPCNVVVRELAPGVMNVAAIDPIKLFTVVGRDDVLAYAKEVKALA